MQLRTHILILHSVSAGLKGAVGGLGGLAINEGNSSQPGTGTEWDHPLHFDLGDTSHLLHDTPQVEHG